MNAAVHGGGKCIDSSVGLGMGGITECGAGNGAPYEGGNIAVPGEGNGIGVFMFGGGNKDTGPVTN